MSREPKPCQTALQLLELVHQQLTTVTAPGYSDPKSEADLLNSLWLDVKRAVGYYGARSFDLNTEQKSKFTECEHYLKILNLLVSQ